MKKSLMIGVLIVLGVLAVAISMLYLSGKDISDSGSDQNNAGGTVLEGSGDYDEGLVGGDADPGPSDGTVCTMEAKMCPDGSAVGRTGPNCEFEACPGQEFTVDITDSGFTPKTLTISQGDTVTWTNMKSGGSWPASNNHPTHNIYQGFDAGRALSSGESYSFTFDKVGSWGYHDHLGASTTGTIVVN